MKNRALIALLLVVALIATSTVTAAATDPEVVTTLDELKAALTNGEVDTIRIDGDFTIRENLTINKTVTVAGGSEIFVGEDDQDRFTVEVAANTTVTVEDGAFFGTRWESPESKLVNRGTFVIDAGGEGGVTENYATMTVHGLNQRGLTNHNGATITVDGELSSVQGDRDGWIWNQGTITIQTGGLLSCVMGTGLVNDATGVLNLNGKLVSAVCFGYEERAPWTEFYNFIRIHANSTVNCSDALYYYGHGGDIEGLPDGMNYEQTVVAALGPGLSCTTDRATFLTHQAAGNVYEIAMRTEENDYDYLGGDEITLQLFLCGSAWETASLRLRVPENFEALDATPVGGYIEINNNTGNGSIGSTKIAEYHFRISNAGITEQTMRRFEIEGVSVTSGGNDYDNVRFDSDVLFIYPDTCELNGGNAWSAGQSDFGREFIVNNRVEIRADQTWDAPITIRDGGELVINGVEINAFNNITIEEGGRLIIDGYSEGDWEQGDYWLHQGRLYLMQGDDPGDPEPVLTNNGEIEVGHDGDDEYGQLWLCVPAHYAGSGEIHTHQAPVVAVCGYDSSAAPENQLVTPYDNRPPHDFDERTMLLVADNEGLRWGLGRNDLTNIIVLNDVSLTADGVSEPYTDGNAYSIDQYAGISVTQGHTFTLGANVRLDISGNFEVDNGSFIAEAGSEIHIHEPYNDDWSQGIFVIRREGTATLSGNLTNDQSFEVEGGLTLQSGAGFTSNNRFEARDEAVITIASGATMNLGGETQIHDRTAVTVNGSLNYDNENWRMEFHGESSLTVNGSFSVKCGEVELCDDNSLTINGEFNVGDGEEGDAYLRLRNINVSVGAEAQFNIDMDGGVDLYENVELHISGTLANSGSFNPSDDTRIHLENSAVFNNNSYMDLYGEMTLASAARVNNYGMLEISDRGSIDQGGVLYNSGRFVNYGNYTVHGGAARIINDSGTLCVDNSDTWHDWGYNPINFVDCQEEDVVQDANVQMMLFTEHFDGEQQQMVYDPWGYVVSEVKGAERDGVSLWLGYDYYGGWQQLRRDQIEYEVTGTDNEHPENTVVFVEPSDDPEDQYTYRIRFNNWGHGDIVATFPQALELPGNINVAANDVLRAGLATELPWTYFFNYQEYSEEAALTNYSTIATGDGEVWYISCNHFDYDIDISIEMDFGNEYRPHYDVHFRNDEVQNNRWISEFSNELRDSDISNYIDLKLVQGDDPWDGITPYDLCIKFSNDMPDNVEWFDIEVVVNGSYNRLHVERAHLYVEDTMTYVDGGGHHVGSVNVRLRNNPGFAAYAFKLCYDPAKLDLTQVTCDYFEFDPESDSITEVGDGAIIIFNSMHDVFLDSELEGHQDLLFNIQFDVLDREGKGYGEFTDDMEVRVEYFNPEGGSVDDFTNENYKSIIPIIQNGVLQTFRWGDVWRTNRIDVKDAVRLLQYINHYHDIELSEAERIAADVTHDDQITIADLTKLLQYLVGYDVTLAPQ